MRTSSKTILNIAAVLTLSTAFVPAISYAQDGSDDSASPTPTASTAMETHSGGHGGRLTEASQAKDGGGFCQRFSKEKDSETGDFDQRTSKLQNDENTFATKRQDVEKSTDQKVETERTQADSLRQEHFTKLESDATTADQTQSVKDFEAAVQAAVTARRTAVDQARDTFRAGVAAAVTTRQAAIQKALATYKAAVQSALTQAQASCTAGTSPQTVQQALRAALTTAHTTLRTSLQAVGKTQVSQLAATYKAAVQAANATFKQAIQDAASKLKTALGQTGDESPSPSATPTATP